MVTNCLDFYVTGHLGTGSPYLDQYCQNNQDTQTIMVILLISIYFLHLRYLTNSTVSAALSLFSNW